MYVLFLGLVVMTLIKINQQMILDIKKQKKSFSWRLKIQNTNICRDKYTTKKIKKNI
jgi:hypothetical protein